MCVKKIILTRNPFSKVTPEIKTGNSDKRLLVLLKIMNMDILYKKLYNNYNTVLSLL